MRFWSHLRASVARFLRLAPPEPGRFETGAKFAWSGLLSAQPWIWPRREYLIYVPRGWSRFRRAPLLVLCHGCRQTPEEFAAGTRIAAFADRAGCLVLLPRQRESANAWRCWNWFDAAVADGRGEAAIVAAMIRTVRWRYRADRARVIVAGMSAGGALAATLALHYAGLVRAAAIHSGLASGAARSAFTALGVMLHGPETDVLATADAARIVAGDAPPVPLLAIHGTSDSIVAAGNAAALVRQFLRFNGHPAAAGDGPEAGLPAADREHRESSGGREASIREWRHRERLVARYVQVAGLGHAWSGGDDAHPYNDSRGPDATAAIGAFLADALP